MRVLLSFLFFCLLSSASFSEEYEQQYAVGDSGPNGGVVTSVTVDSVISDTLTEVIGDFEETTDTWTHTETVVEKIESTATETVTDEIVTTIVTQETTENSVCLNCNVMGDTSGDAITFGDYGRFGYRGGTISGTVDLSEYLTQDQINSGFDVDASVDTMTCLNTIGSNVSCNDVGNPTADTLKITITVTDGTSTYTNTTEHTIDWNPSQFRTVTGSLGVPSNNLSDTATATLSLYGIDNGYWGGHYGPTVTDPSMTFTYDVTEYVTQQIEREIERTVYEYVTTELVTETEVFDSVYIGSPAVDIIIEPISETSFEVVVIEMDDVGNELVEVFEIDVAEVNMEISSEMELAPLEVDDTESDTGELSAEVQEEVDEPQEDVQESSEDVEQPVEVAEESTDEQPTSKTEVRKDTRKSTTSSYSVALESVKVALMVQNEASRAFTAYQQETVPDVPFYSPVEIDGGETVDNPYAKWMTGASEVLWDNMVDEQWQR